MVEPPPPSSVSPTQETNGLPPGMDMNTYSHYYYSTYYPEYYAQLQASASTQSSGPALYSSSSATTSTTNSVSSSSMMGSMVGPALGSRVAGDKAFRQMSHYFNYEAYNDAVNQDAKDGKKIALKLTRKEINILKHRKMERKKKRMLDWLYND